jgi:hypothetical protein
MAKDHVQLCFPPADLADLVDWNSEEHRQPITPLISQLLAVCPITSVLVLRFAISHAATAFLPNAVSAQISPS